MNDWHYAQTDPRQQLAHLHFFSINKLEGEREIEIVITVKETITPAVGTMRFFAQADKQTNQRTTPYTPSGWGTTLLEAMRACIREIDRFPYEG
jgi:hypothetical protein